MPVSRHNIGSTGSPLADEVSELLKDYLYDNYDESVTAVPKSEVTFASDFANLSNSRYLVVVFPINKTSDHIAAGNLLKQIDDFFRIYVIANGAVEKNNHWKIEDHLYDLIDSNPEGLEASGIYDMEITDFQQLRSYAPDSNLQNLIADPSFMKSSYARVTLRYTKSL